MIALDGRSLTLSQLVRIAAGARVDWAPSARANLREGRRQVEAFVRSGRSAYGVTTGVGSQKDFAVASEDLATFNHRLLLAHATRVPGAEAPAGLVRAALAVQLNHFASGASGVTPALADRLMARLESAALPTARLGSSVGSSDIVALSQLAVPTLTAEWPLGSKEGLSLLNSNSLTVAHAALTLQEARHWARAANEVAALSLEGWRGQPAAWRLAAHPDLARRGQITVAESLTQSLRGSRLWEAEAPRFLQDPLSFRCVPQIHGTLETALQLAEDTVSAELNRAVDNPFVEAATGELISHGNMDTSQLSWAFDGLRLALAKVAQASAERLHKQHWSVFSGLPVGLARHDGAEDGVQFLNLGHLASAQLAATVAAAAPVSLLYGGQVCEGVEDTASLAPLAVERCEDLLRSAWTGLALEAVVGAWAVARRELPMATLGEGVRPLYLALCPFLPIGRVGEAVWDLAPALAALRAVTQDREL